MKSKAYMTRLVGTARKILDVLLYIFLQWIRMLVAWGLRLSAKAVRPAGRTLLHFENFGIEAILRIHSTQSAVEELTHPHFEKTVLLRVSSEKSRVDRLGKSAVCVNVHIPDFGVLEKLFPHTRRALKGIMQLWAASRMLQRVRPICMEALSPNAMVPVATYLKWIHGVPLVAQVRGNLALRYHRTGHPAYFPIALASKVGKLALAQWDGFVQWCFYSACDLVVGYNINNMQSAISYGAHPLKTRLLRIEVKFDIQDEPLRSRSELDGFPADGRVLSFWSRLEPQKYVLEASKSACLSMKKYPDLHLVVIGDGSLRAAIGEYAREQGVGDRVHLLGHRDMAYIRSAAAYSDIVLVPLGGSSLVEAALLERPIVGYDVEWQSEVISTGLTGQLADLGSPEDMARKINGYLEAPELAREHARACRNLVIKMFDREQLKSRESDIFHDFLHSIEGGGAQ